MDLKIVIPKLFDNVIELNNILGKLFESISIKRIENKKLAKLQSLLLAKMGQ